MADSSPRAGKNIKPDVAMKNLVSAKARKEFALAEAAEIEIAYAKKQIVIRSEAVLISVQNLPGFWVKQR